MGSVLDGKGAGSNPLSTRVDFSKGPPIEFEAYKIENLERIANDPRYAKHHAEIDAILSKREGHLYRKRGLEVLTEIAKTGKTTNYKAFFEACVGGEMKWNHTKMGKVAKFLGDIQRFCGENDLPILSSLVVNIQTGECGEGFFNELLKLGLASSLDDPKAAAQKERDRCWKWAASL